MIGGGGKLELLSIEREGPDPFVRLSIWDSPWVPFILEEGL
jgi:hypothetical protein